MHRLVRYTVDDRAKRMTTSATTFSQLRRDLKTVDPTLPTDFVIFLEVCDESGVDWQSELCYPDLLIPSTLTPALHVLIQPLAPKPLPPPPQASPPQAPPRRLYLQEVSIQCTHSGARNERFSR